MTPCIVVLLYCFSLVRCVSVGLVIVVDRLRFLQNQMSLIRSPPVTRLMSASSRSNKQQSSASPHDTDDSVFLSSDFAQMLKLYNEIKQLCLDTHSKVNDLQVVVNKLMDENLNLKANISEIQNNTANLLQNDEKMNSARNSTTKILADAVHDRTASFSQVLKSNHAVLIKPKLTTQSSQVTKDDMRKNIDPSGIAISSVRNSAEGGIVVECSSQIDSNRLLTNAASQLGSNYEVRVPAKRSTKIRIVGISENLTNECLVEKLRQQNPEIFFDVSTMVVVHVFKLRNSFGYKIEVDAETFNRVMTNNRKLRVGWDICFVSEDLDIVRCFNCSAYHHTAKKCISKACCPICSEEHKLSDCTSRYLCCINCKDASKTLKMQIDSSHPANSPDCPVYKRKVEQQQRRTNYTSR